MLTFAKEPAFEFNYYRLVVTDPTCAANQYQFVFYTSIEDVEVIANTIHTAMKHKYDFMLKASNKEVYDAATVIGRANIKRTKNVSCSLDTLCLYLSTLQFFPGGIKGRTVVEGNGQVTIDLLPDEWE